MKILLVGGGAREHAMAEAIVRNSGELYSFMKARNPGIARLSKEFTLGDINNGTVIAKWAKEKNVELAVVGPEEPMQKGVVDELEAVGVKCASPCKAAARLEWDKTFARNLLKNHSIPGCPVFAVFNEKNKGEIASCIRGLNNEVAVKPSGLTGGKGVKMGVEHLKTIEESVAYAIEVVESGIGGLGEVVIEERLVGEEFTLQAFVDGKNVVGMPCVQDHKRAFENDVGGNTGGMGSYTNAGNLLPFMKQADYDEAVEIMRKTIRALASESVVYKGSLYGQFMLTRDGAKVIEFNSRFGDPEAMNVLPILKTNYVELLAQMSEGRLSRVEFERKATVCKYLVPDGYPDNPMKNEEIKVDEKAIAALGARVYFASVSEENGVVRSSSSRAVGVLGVGASIEEAEATSEKACACVKGKLFHRKDIGTKQLVEKRVEHMKEVRGS
ncbi:phosphoribosylamine--glycine ligase [Candidatus Micrarchaeota archaeon]|nr:phosphoribosylamine--glycine ligase [Candidatus Micrarchaeota archaeon]